MDSIVEKYVNGDLSDEQFDAEKAKLSGEDQVKLDDLLKQKTIDTRTELKAITAEKLRRQAALEKVVTQPKAEDVSTQFRAEQLGIAKDRFFKDRGIAAEDQSKITDLFKKHDSGKLTPEGITEDLKKAYIEANGDRLLSAADRIADMEKGAAFFNSGSAGPGGSGSGGGDEKRFAPEVLELVEKARRGGETLSPEAAEKYLTKGLSRTYKI